MKTLHLWLREWTAVLRQPSRERQLCDALGAELITLPHRIAAEVHEMLNSDGAQSCRCFELAVRPSTAVGAGLGLFVSSGTVPAGTAIALYPGIHFRSAEEWATCRHDASYVLNLSTHDGAPYGCIDAAAEPHTNPQCCAHLINHPPPDRMANVCPAAFRWTDIAGSQEEAAVNTQYTPQPYACAGAAMVALTSIRPGEELFLDYRLRPRVSLCDVVTARRSWHERYPSWYEVPGLKGEVPGMLQVRHSRSREAGTGGGRRIWCAGRARVSPMRALAGAPQVSCIIRVSFTSGKLALGVVSLGPLLQAKPLHNGCVVETFSQTDTQPRSSRAARPTTCHLSHAYCIANCLARFDSTCAVWHLCVPKPSYLSCGSSFA